MKVVILGFGRFGRSVAAAFVRDGHDVTVVDTNKKLAATAEENYDLRALAGHGSHPEVLEKAGAESADMLLAATGNDEVNMVACQICASLHKTPIKIARLQTSGYINQPKLLFLSDTIDAIITPEHSLAENLFNLVDFSGASEVINLEGLYLFGVRVPPQAEILGQSSQDVREILEKDDDIWFVSVSRDHSLVSDESPIQAHDLIYFCGKKQPSVALISLLGQSVQKQKKALILGGGGVGLKLGELLVKKNFQVTIIEEKKERAEVVAAANEEFVVLNNNALNEALIKDVIGDGRDLTAISVTDRDEVNLLSLLMIKSQNPKVRTISLLNHKNLSHLVGRFRLDVGVFTWNITLPLVAKYLRKSGVLKMNYPLLNCDAHCLLIRVAADSFLVGKNPQKLLENYKILTAAIKRGDDFYKPEDVVDLEVNDSLICLVEAKNLEKVEKVLF